jgi:hypothetical protein
MRLVVALLSVVALAFAAPAAADPPTVFPIQEVFTDINPCTGDTMTVTFVGTASVHEHDSRFVVQVHRTITTSDGFFGHGTNSTVFNGQVFRSRQADVMTNASGDRFLARFVFVFDVSTETVRVEKEFGLTCIRP